MWRDPGGGILAISILGSKVAQWSAAGLLAGDITALNGTIQNLSVTDVFCSTIDADTISASVGITAPVISSAQGEFGTLHATGVSYLEGRVGVGKIADPSYMVDVQGAIRGIGNGGAGGLRVVNAVGDSGGSFTCPAGLSQGVGISADGGPIRFTAGGAERGVFDTNGNFGVGVGATTPAVRVHAMGPGSASRFRAQSTDSGGVIADWMADGALAAWIGTISNHNLQLATNSGVRATLNPLGWLSLGMSTSAAEQRNFQIRDSSGAQIILGNRTNSASSMTFGALLFDAFRDIASPSLVAGMWAEGVAPAGNNSDLVLGVQQNGTTSYPLERMRIFGSGGQVRMGPPTAGTMGASGLEVIGSGPTLLLRCLPGAGSAPGYQGLRIYNDLNTPSRALEIDYYGSAYAGSLGWGPTGEQAAIAPTGAYPLVLGANNNARIWINADGGQPVKHSSNGAWHNTVIDPNSNAAAIPIGGIIAGEAAGASFGGLQALGEIALNGSNTITMYGYTPAANTVLTTGNWRLLSRVSANFGVWVKTA